MTFTIKAFIILGFTISLLYIAIKLIQKYSKTFLYTKLGKHTNIKIEGIFYLDDSNKLVTLRYKSIIYLILLNKTNNILLDKYEITQELY